MTARLHVGKNAKRVKLASPQQRAEQQVCGENASSEAGQQAHTMPLTPIVQRLPEEDTPCQKLKIGCKLQIRGHKKPGRSSALESDLWSRARIKQIRLVQTKLFQMIDGRMRTYH